MSGGSQQTTSQSQVQPYKGSQPLINSILGDATRAYRQGMGSQPYTGSTVIPFSNQTMQAQRGIMGVANQNVGGRGLNGQAQDIINQGGFNDYQRGSLNDMQNQLRGLGSDGLTGAQGSVLNRFQGQMRNLGGNGLTNAQDSVLNRFQNTMQGLGQNGLTNAQDMAMQNFRQLANSDYSLNANPGARGVLNAALRDQANAVNLNAAAAGRYGSGVHEGVLAREAGDLSNEFRYNDFNNWLGRRDAANTSMANLAQQGLGNIQGLGQNINALGQQGFGNVQQLGQNINALGQQGVQNRQGLSSSIFNAGQAGLGNMTNAYQAQQMPYQSMAGVGSQMEDLATRQMNDRLRIWNETQNAPLTNFRNYLGIAGLNGQFNNTNTTTTAPGQNPFLTAVGGMGLLSAFL